MRNIKQILGMRLKEALAERFVLDDGTVVAVILVPVGEPLNGYLLNSGDHIEWAPRAYHELHINQGVKFVNDGLCAVLLSDPRVKQYEQATWSRQVREKLAANKEIERNRIVCDGDHPLDLD